jgi:hypothetical protein
VPAIGENVLVDELPLHPAAEAVLGTGPAWTAAELVAAMASQVEGVAAALAGGFDSWGADASASVDTAVLVGAARREVERGGGLTVRCEHLLLGLVRVLGPDDALLSARKDYQRLKGEQAHGEYLKLRPLPRPGRTGSPRTRRGPLARHTGMARHRHLGARPADAGPLGAMAGSSPRRRHRRRGARPGPGPRPGRYQRRARSWLVIVASVILSSAASRTALDRMRLSTWSPSNGSSTLPR